MKGRLVIFCGIPGSGKTTIARVVAEKTPRSVLVQTDALRAMIARPNYGGEESGLVYDGCMAVAREALRRGYTVLLDGTFMREEYRERARRTLRGYAAATDVVHVSCELEVALRRNSARHARIPPAKVRSIHRRFQEPRRAIRVDSTRLSPGRAAAQILERLL